METRYDLIMTMDTADWLAWLTEELPQHAALEREIT